VLSETTPKVALLKAALKGKAKSELITLDNV
jgi:hypothetical protein